MRWGIIVLIILLALLAYSSLFVVKAGQCVIITQFGKTIRVIQEPGLYLKLPWILHTVNRLDARMNTFKTNPIQLLLGDKNPIIMTLYVVWAIDKPSVFFEAIGSKDLAVSKINDMINSELSEKLSAYKLDNIINVNQDKVKIAELEERMQASADNKARKNYGIRITSIGVRRINYPAIVAEAVYNRMKAEREKEAKKFRAEGVEESTKIKAQTDRMVAEIVSGAKKEAEKIKGQGDYEASLVYGKAFAKDRAFFELLKSLEALRTVINEKSVLILSTDNYLFELLRPSKQRVRGRKDGQ